jgi:hypothetical protein
VGRNVVSQDKIADLLERAAARVPDSHPPLEELLRDGHRGIRRRTSWRIAASTAAVVIMAVAVAFLGGAVSRPSPAPPGPLPAPPAGTKWSGVDDQVVAVPESWSMWPDLYCSSHDGHDHVTIVEAGLVSTCTPPTPHMPPSTIASLSTVGGDLEVTIDWDPLHTPARETAANVLRQRIQATRTALPSGWLAIPPPATSGRRGDNTADDEVRALEAAGFNVARGSEPAWGDGPRVVTEPEIGAPARVGSTVTVIERLPAPASASLGGRLVWVGGPAGGTTPHAGTIHVVGNGIDAYIPAGPDGHWSFQGPGGRYTVEGTSPGYLSRAGATDACRARHPVTVRLMKSVRVDVLCQLK